MFRLHRSKPDSRSAEQPFYLLPFKWHVIKNAL